MFDPLQLGFQQDRFLGWEVPDGSHGYLLFRHSLYYTDPFAICQAIIPFFKLLASIPAAVSLLTAGTLR